ncbi:hypothetical protein ACJ41O_008461 [Fusarium nematophilum]
MAAIEKKQPDLGEKTSSVVDGKAVPEHHEPVVPEKIPFFRGTTCQALIVAFLFFSGPGMISALGAVGAGGLKDPLLVNITSGMQYGMNCFFAFFAGVAINVLGVRGALCFGLLCFPVRGASLYCANKFKTVWFIYFASAVGGLTSSILWVVQGAIILSYPEPWKKGFFKIILLLPMFIYSQWYLSYHGNFNAVYHSVRGRALGGLLHSITGILGNITFWYMTDRSGWTRSQVARRGYYIIFSLCTSSWIYNIVVQKLYTDWQPVGLDWVEGDYWLSIILYIYWQYANDMYQCYVYFLIGTLSTEVEELARYTGILKTVNTAGTAFGYAVQVKWTMMGGASLLTGLWFAQIIPTWLVVREVSDEEPGKDQNSSASASGSEVLA